MITYYCICRHRRRRQERAEHQDSQTRQNEYIDLKDQFSESSVSLVSDTSVLVKYELPGDPPIYGWFHDKISQVSVPVTESDTQSLPELHSETSLIPQDMRQIFRIPSPSSYNMNSYTSPPAQTPARSKVIPERIVVTPPTPTHDSKESNQFSMRDATVVQNREPLKNGGDQQEDSPNPLSDQEATALNPQSWLVNQTEVLIITKAPPLSAWRRSLERLAQRRIN